MHINPAGDIQISVEETSQQLALPTAASGFYSSSTVCITAASAGAALAPLWFFVFMELRLQS